MAERFRQPLMPWQRLVADVGGEMVEDPETGLLVPAYRNVVFSTPRQSGKTTLVLGWECQRAIGWEHLGPQRISYSAQTGSDARKKLINDQKPVIEPHKRALGIRRIYEAIGAEGVVWLNGSRLVLLNNTEAGGHGPSVDLGVKDELFADFDNRRDQALVPSMATRPAGQVLSCSTMGTDDSVPWNALVDRGRAAVESGLRSGIAYFEWSASDDDDLDDPEVWWTFMPALGFTITEAVVANDRDTLPPGEFVRAYGNRKTTAQDRVLPEADWNAVCTPAAAPAAKPVFSLDVNPERTAGAIVAASAGVAELLEYRYTTGWLVGRAKELSERWGKPWWVVDATAGSPASSFVAELERAGLNVHPATAAEVTRACGQLYSGVIERTVAIRRHQRLDEAAAGAAKRFIGDAFAWTRKNAAADVCPLMALTLALWGAEELPDDDEVGELITF